MVCQTCGTDYAPTTDAEKVIAAVRDLHRESTEGYCVTDFEAWPCQTESVLRGCERGIAFGPPPFTEETP